VDGPEAHIKWKEVELGETDMTLLEEMVTVAEIKFDPRFFLYAYDPCKWNCHEFMNEFSRRARSTHPLPRWILAPHRNLVTGVKGAALRKETHTTQT